LTVAGAGYKINRMIMRYLIVFVIFTIGWLAYAFFTSSFGGWDMLAAVTFGAMFAGSTALVDTIVANRAPNGRRYVNIGIATVAILLVTGLVIWLWAKPVPIEQLRSTPNPAADYSEAVTRVQALQARDDDLIRPECRTQFMDHGQKTDQVIVLFHGLSNCPEQLWELGEEFHQMGYNVLIPRFPYHGYQDRMTTAQENMTAEELAAFGDEVVDIAQGLGDHVTVAGFSMGGALTAWLAQQRPDIDQAVLIAPAISVGVLPPESTSVAANAMLEAPNTFIWWDPVLKEKQQPEHGYPRFASQALGQLLRLGSSVLDQAETTAPATNNILVITNQNDAAVNNAVATNLADLWRNKGANVETFSFERDIGLEHDLLDPHHPKQQVDKVYPVLTDLIAN
jgi:esterase/lipase